MVNRASSAASPHQISVNQRSPAVKQFSASHFLQKIFNSPFSWTFSGRVTAPPSGRHIRDRIFTIVTFTSAACV
jgi:hypothetical protein